MTGYGEKLLMLLQAAETVRGLEPRDLDDKRLREVVEEIHEHASQLVWASNLGRPEFRP